MTDDESPHPGYVIFSRRRNECKPANHDTLHYKVHLAEWRRGALPFQDLEKIAMVGLRGASVTLLNRSGNIFAYRTAPCSIRILPSQAVLLAGVADDVLGILVYVVDA